MKFKGVPPEARQRIANASTDELDRWAERILTATRFDDVLR